MSATDASDTSQFQGLIDNLREKAITEAEEKAVHILNTAEKRAAEILASARRDADEVLSRAQETAQKAETAGHDALRRASRDVLLSLEETITAQLNAVMHRETREVVRGEVLAVMVRTLVEKWDFNGDEGNPEVLISEKDLASLEEAGWHGLKDDLLEGVAVRPVPGVEAGLRIGSDNGTVHYDFTAQTLAEWMGRFVTPKIRETLREVSEQK